MLFRSLWVREKPKNRANQKIEVSLNDAEINSEQIKNASYKANIVARKDTKVQINTIYFPGWQVESNGSNIPIEYQNKYGLINFNLPQGEHEVIIKYNKTPVHLASEMISLLAIIATGGYLSYLWRKQNS